MIFFSCFCHPFHTSSFQKKTWKKCINVCKRYFWKAFFPAKFAQILQTFFTKHMCKESFKKLFLLAEQKCRSSWRNCTIFVWLCCWVLCLYSFLWGVMLHYWFGFCFCFVLLSSMPGGWNLKSLIFDWYNIVPYFIEVFILHSLHFQYRWFPFTFISPLIISWHFWQKPVFGRILLSCKKRRRSICGPLIVSIITNRLMQIGGSILYFLDLQSELVLGDFLKYYKF